EHLLIVSTTGRRGSGGRLHGIVRPTSPVPVTGFFLSGLAWRETTTSPPTHMPGKGHGQPPKLRGNPHDSRSRSGLPLPAGITERSGDNVLAASRLAPPGIDLRQQRQKGPDRL